LKVGVTTDSESESRSLKELLKSSVPDIEAKDAMAVQSGVELPAGGSLLRAVDTVVNWMESGECDKKTAANFYVFLQV
jgi:hypothetical protein